MPTINAPLAKLLNIDVPIVSAPMAFAATSDLASAVTAAGAFGMMGAGFLSSQVIKDNFALARKRLGIKEGEVVPIGIGCIGWILDMTESSDDPRLEAILNEKPAALWLAFGVDLGKYVKQIRQFDAKRNHKTPVFIIVNSVEGALTAKEWGVDVIVAQGTEAGGHGGSESPPLLTLLQAILNALPSSDRPLVIAAGGVSTGKQIAALLTMGADGVALGTRFLFTNECIYSDLQKQAIVQAGNNATVRTLAYDDVGRTNYWPPKHNGRALINKVMDDVAEGIDLDERLKRFDESAEKGLSDRLVVWAGVGVGLTDKITSAAEVVDDLRKETLDALRHAASLSS